MKVVIFPACGRVRIGGILAMTVLAAGCGEEVVVRTESRVYADGGIARRVEVTGREADGTTPSEPDWLANGVEVRLAVPAAWARVETSADRLLAEGFFRSGAEIPPSLAHAGPSGEIADRSGVQLDREDLVVATRWTWRESLGDPFAGGDTAAALDTLSALTARTLEAEIARTFGDEVDPSPAGRFVRTDLRKLLADLLPSVRAALVRSGATTGVSRDEWRKVMVRHGVPVAAEGDLFSPGQIDEVLEWMRARTARAISTRKRPVAAEELSFWPLGEDADAKASAIIERGWGNEDAFAAETSSALDTLAGYYGREGSARFRFDARLALPGRLLGTNGTPDGDAVVWIFRDESLTVSTREMTARSLELAEEPLRLLGARRELDAAGLLRLSDLLSDQQLSGDLRELLRAAVARGDLSLLREVDRIADALEPLALELADLLDPAIPARRWGS